MAVTVPRSWAWRMADRLYDGQLAERLKTLRREGHSYEHIARTLHAERGVEVSGTTVRTWLKTLGIKAA